MNTIECSVDYIIYLGVKRIKKKKKHYKSKKKLTKYNDKVS